jgi:hypothetical protein
MERDSLHERGRALEEEYFRKKDRELLGKMLAVAEAQKARADIGAKTGLDEASAKELQDLGFTLETLSLLPLVPLVQVAWADRGITVEERAAVVKLARARGITEGSAADRQLTSWLTTRPAEKVFTQATRLIAAMLESSPDVLGMSPDDLVKYCESIAQASGGVLGFGAVASDEKDILKSLAATLKK